MGQINTNNYPTVSSLADADLLIVENATHGTGTTTPKQLRENAIGTDPLQTTAQTVTGAINELKNSGSLPENPLSITHGGTGNTDGYIRTGQKANTTMGISATAEGANNTTSGAYSHAEGHSNTASGNYSHVEGRLSTASAYTAHAEGANTIASNDSAHSEGEHTLASSTASHAEGFRSTASGIGAHSEGSAYVDFDTGNYVGNTASGEGAHAEGMGTTASGTASHTEGYGTTASGNYSHASGGSTTAGYAYQTVVGKINDNKSSTLFEVGNGTGANARSNAFEVYSDGKTSWDNGSSKFQFTQNNGSDGYYDASGTFHAFGSGGGGSTMSKTRYTISSSSWSASANASGYYTYSVTLNPTLSTSFCPNVSLSGSGDSTIWTDTQKSQYDLIDHYDNTATNTLVLYAKTKPTSTFYIYVEGVNN